MNYIVKYYGRNPRVAYDGSLISDDFDRYRRISLKGLLYSLENEYHPTFNYRYNPKTKKLDKIKIVRYEIWKADDRCYKTVGNEPVHTGKIKE